MSNIMEDRSSSNDFNLPPVLHEAVSPWFLGSQAENATLLKDLFAYIVNSHAEARKAYHPEDGVGCDPTAVEEHRLLKNLLAF